MRVVVGDGDGGQVGKQGEEDDELRTDRLVDDDHASNQVNLQVQTQRDTVLDVRLHPLEDLTGNLDRRDNRRQTGCKEDNVRSRLRSLGRPFDGDTAVRLLQRRSIVDTVARHGR